MTRHVAKVDFGGVPSSEVAGGVASGVSRDPAVQAELEEIVISDSEDGSDSEMSSGYSSNIYSLPEEDVESPARRGLELPSVPDIDVETDAGDETGSSGDDSHYDPDGLRFDAEETLYVLQCRMISWLVGQGIDDAELPRVKGAFLLARSKILACEWDSMRNAREYDWCLNGDADQCIRMSKMSELSRNIKAKRGFTEESVDEGVLRGKSRQKSSGAKA